MKTRSRHSQKLIFPLYVRATTRSCTNTGPGSRHEVFHTKTGYHLICKTKSRCGIHREYLVLANLSFIEQQLDFIYYVVRVNILNGLNNILVKLKYFLCIFTLFKFIFISILPSRQTSRVRLRTCDIVTYVIIVSEGNAMHGDRFRLRITRIRSILLRTFNSFWTNELVRFHIRLGKRNRAEYVTRSAS